MAYQIVEWIYDQFDELNDFKSKQVAKDRLNQIKNGQDSIGQAKIDGWLNNDDWYTRRFKAKQFEAGVDNANRNYQQDKIEEVRAAESNEELKKIEDSVDKDYEQETFDEIKKVINQLKGTFIDEKEIKKAKTLINKATKQTDLDKVDLDSIQEATNLETRNEIAELIKDRVDDLLSLEDEVLQDIESATTVAELNAVDISQADTSDVRAALSDRRTELTQPQSI